MSASGVLHVFLDKVVSHNVSILNGSWVECIVCLIHWSREQGKYYKGSVCTSDTSIQLLCFANFAKCVTFTIVTSWSFAIISLNVSLTSSAVRPAVTV